MVVRLYPKLWHVHLNHSIGRFLNQGVELRKFLTPEINIIATVTDIDPQCLIHVLLMKDIYTLQ